MIESNGEYGLPKAFQRWQSRVPEETRFLSQLVIERILPEFIKLGFKPVTTELGQKNDRVAASEIRLERSIGEYIDGAHFYFAKYDDPAFLLKLSRQTGPSVDEVVHIGNVIEKAGQYHYEWGKQSLMPRFLWTKGAAERAVSKIVPLLDQCFRFIETGERGPNISIKL
jgi:hypothetical protein